MKLYQILLVVAACGAFGGLVNSLLSGGFDLPHSDKDKRVWRPGWLANVGIGIAAALIVWGLYGPAAQLDLAKPIPLDFHLPVAQVCGSILVGISGARILTALAEKQADQIAKNDLSQALGQFIDQLNKQQHG
jgi:hypothetical protein